MAFNKLCLDPKILKAITEAGYSQPTKIQLEAIPQILKGGDVRGSAQTGTGKTAAFLLPALNQLITNKPKGGTGPRVLIIVPTRELAMQITSQAEKYSKYMDRVRTVCISGGVSYYLQQRKMSRPYEVLVATPGRLLDYVNQGKINFSRLEMLVLDEADRMLDMGFAEPMKEIVAAIPTSRQTLLFSATLSASILKLSNQFLSNPTDVVVHEEKEKHENIVQNLHYVDNLGHKNRILDHILAEDGVEYTIIFTSTKRHADQLVRELNEKGHRVQALHGDMNQSQRSRTIARFRDGKLKVLVATDVAARGLDVQHITHVVNFDLPRNIEDYVHRIGRTGRAGAKGTALSFAAERDTSLVKRIEKFTGHPIDIKEIEGLEPSKKKSTPSSFKRRGRPGGGQKRHSFRGKSKGNSGRFKDNSKRRTTKPLRKAGV